jgi:hypothetical protein
MAILLPIPASTLGLECYVINGRYNQFCCTSQPRSENSDVVQRRERRTVGSLTEAEARIACGNPSVSVLYHKSDHVRFEERTGDEKALLLHIAIRLRKFGGRTTAQRSRCWLFSEGYRGRRKVGIADGFRLCQFFKTEIRSDPKSLNEDREYCFQKKRNLHPCSVARRTPTPNVRGRE